MNNFTKGISPLIATILLIAFTVAVGGIVSLWITGFTQTQTSQVSAGSTDQVQCGSSVLTVSSAKFISGAANTVTFQVGYNLGNIELTIPVAYSGCGANLNDSTTSTTFQPSYSSTTIKPGDTKVYLVNTSGSCGGSATTVDFVRIRAICKGPVSGLNYTVFAQCNKGEGCGI